jgi:hypothetical protein
MLTLQETAAFFTTYHEKENNMIVRSMHLLARITLLRIRPPRLAGWGSDFPQDRSFSSLCEGVYGMLSQRDSFVPRSPAKEALIVSGMCWATGWLVGREGCFWTKRGNHPMRCAMSRQQASSNMMEGGVRSQG